MIEPINSLGYCGRILSSVTWFVYCGRILGSGQFKSPDGVLLDILCQLVYNTCFKEAR